MDFSYYKAKLEKRNIIGSEVLAEILLSEISLAMLPGTDFYLPDSDLIFRVSTVDYDGEDVLIAAKNSLEIGLNLDDDFVERNCPNLMKACAAIKTWLAQL